jgi:hypothetical protein
MVVSPVYDEREALSAKCALHKGECPTDKGLFGDGGGKEVVLPSTARRKEVCGLEG